MFFMFSLLIYFANKNLLIIKLLIISQIYFANKFARQKGLEPSVRLLNFASMEQSPSMLGLPKNTFTNPYLLTQDAAP